MANPIGSGRKTPRVNLTALEQQNKAPDSSTPTQSPPLDAVVPQHVKSPRVEFPRLQSPRERILSASSHREKTSSVQPQTTEKKEKSEGRFQKGERKSSVKSPRKQPAAHRAPLSSFVVLTESKPEVPENLGFPANEASKQTGEQSVPKPMRNVDLEVMEMIANAAHESRVKRAEEPSISNPTHAINMDFDVMARRAVRPLPPLPVLKTSLTISQPTTQGDENLSDYLFPETAPRPENESTAHEIPRDQEIFETRTTALPVEKALTPKNQAEVLASPSIDREESGSEFSIEFVELESAVYYETPSLSNVDEFDRLEQELRELEKRLESESFEPQQLPPTIDMALIESEGVLTNPEKRSSTLATIEDEVNDLEKYTKTIDRPENKTLQRQERRSKITTAKSKLISPEATAAQIVSLIEKEVAGGQPTQMRVLNILRCAAGGSNVLDKRAHPELQTFADALIGLPNDKRLGFLIALTQKLGKYLSKEQQEVVLVHLKRIKANSTYPLQAPSRDVHLRALYSELLRFLEN